ncbi:putative F-box protein At3g52320 [Henckelia pumila]|uniref:putative F-box protein At3g52320 n=1 Tax=Henckelia pumila TaxID=405737 RepID=UPI003C6E56DC
MPMKKKPTNICCFLPDEIVENILHRLPTKTLLKYKIVCKRWKSLISSTSFKRLHENKSLENPVLILFSRQEGKPFLTTVDLSGAVLDRWDLASIGLQNSAFLPSPFGSDNLLCLVVDMQRFFVCNPSTRRACQICLPKASMHCPSGISKASFGYVPDRNQYVIVAKFKGRRNWRMITLSRDDVVVSAGNIDERWKIIKDSARYRVADGSPWGVFADGILYWTGDADDRRCLTCFDLWEEKFFVVLLPDEIVMIQEYQDDDQWLVELNGDLHLMYKKEGQQDIELWKLDGAGDWGWSKQDMCVAGFRARFGAHFRPVMMDEKGEMLVYNGGFMEWYKLKHEVFRMGGKGYKNIHCHAEDVILDFKLHIDTLL